MCRRTDSERSTKKMGKYQEDDAPSGGGIPSGSDTFPNSHGYLIRYE